MPYVDQKYNESKARSDLVKLLKKKESGYSSTDIMKKLKKYSEGTVLFAIFDLQEAGIVNGNVLMGTHKLPSGKVETDYGIKLKPKYFSKLNSQRGDLIVI